ncbi:diacylglycerol/lipid kinase family protein [Alkalibacillus haloalkaliphilus]|uniref:diacylglycerol/lipid kinase family protein n=1 Tax=Alkalibacillus haloalkaliphilus TaxID=94136 RepID=UPI002935680F|nr:diacylglycerol kinase family lipid kinase [Alkalibacillus haloalkaliphilus]MDV2581267.1 diacylglycerol kinase family lipid kinase [Alkalibacillus haloalkaliphilus]
MYAFIINYKAGSQKASSVYNYIKERHHDKISQHKTYYTQYEGHATELTKTIVNSGEVQTIIIIGGDGTVYEVFNGLKNNDIAIGLIPTGSGNDFARGCGMELNPYKQADLLFQQAESMLYWLGEYEVSGNQYVFASSIGFGFDGEVAQTVDQSSFKKWLNIFRLKQLIYVYGLIKNVFTYKPKNLSLNVDGECIKMDNTWLITVSNHPYFGGGMKIAPNAEVNDQHFTITTVSNISRMKILLLFITVFFGKHTSLKEVDCFNGSTVSISSDTPLIYQADGFTDEVDQCHIRKHLQSFCILK